MIDGRLLFVCVAKNLLLYRAAVLPTGPAPVSMGCISTHFALLHRCLCIRSRTMRTGDPFLLPSDPTVHSGMRCTDLQSDLGCD